MEVVNVDVAIVDQDPGLSDIRQDIINVNNVEDNIPSRSASPSPSLSDKSLDLTLQTETLSHPLTASYKEWICNWFSVSIPAIGFLGCQLSLALQNGFVTPELEELGISEKMVAYCWLAPPLTGCFVQPLIGITSDMMDPSVPNSIASKYGRRRPFVAVGCVMVVIFLLLFSNARHIGALLGDTEDDTPKAALIAVISFWFLDISINVVQAPLRALVSDIIPSKFHTTANGIFGFANGLGAIIGYALGYGIAYNPKLGGGLSALFAIAAFTVICTSILMLALTKGEKLMYISSTSLSQIIAKNYAAISVQDQEREAMIQSEPAADDHQPSPHNASGQQPVDTRSKFQRIRAAMGTMPKPISRAFMVQFWLYFGLFASYIYLTDWFGKKVTHGDPHSKDADEVDAYRYGVKIASIGLSFGAILAVCGSMLLPVIINGIGYRWTWFVCMLFYGIMLLSTPFCDNIPFALTIVTCLGIGQAAAMVIGWSIVTETLSDSNQKGVYTTLFSTSHTIPELVVAITSGFIIHLFDDNVSAVLAIGGVAALFGANSALYIVEPSNWLRRQKDLKRQNRILNNRQDG